MKLFRILPGRRARRDAELDDELRAHLAMAVADRVSRGESPEEAEANARRELGSDRDPEPEY